MVSDMIKITVAQTAVRELSGVAKTSGKPYSMRIQSAYAFTVDKDGNPVPFPEKFEVILDKDAQPYPVGEYTLAPSALYVDRTGNLACSPRLTPIKARAAA